MNDDLPEPLGPTTMFNRADGAMTHFSCVINFSRTTCLMLLHAKGGAQSQAAPITPPVPFKKTKFTNHRRDVHAAGGLPVAFDPSHRHSARNKHASNGQKTSGRNHAVPAPDIVVVKRALTRGRSHGGEARRPCLPCTNSAQHDIHPPCGVLPDRPLCGYGVCEHTHHRSYHAFECVDEAVQLWRLAVAVLLSWWWAWADGGLVVGLHLAGGEARPW